MLAYVFWHWPRPDVDRARYAEGLLRFHRALAASPPEGYLGSRVLEVVAAPWLPAPAAYEDWYFVEGFAALGALNEGAVTGRRQEPHDAAARLVQDGRAGVYKRLRESQPGEVPARAAAWFGKPAGVLVPDFVAPIEPGELWQRQMVLGPAPEFCLLGADAPARAVDPTRLEIRRLA
jgi:hypothetical protein